MKLNFSFWLLAAWSAQPVFAQLSNYSVQISSISESALVWTEPQNPLLEASLKTVKKSSTSYIVRDIATDQETEIKLHTVGRSKFFSVVATDPADLDTAQMQLPQRVVRHPYPKQTYPYLIYGYNNTLTAGPLTGESHYVSGQLKQLYFKKSDLFFTLPAVLSGRGMRFTSESVVDAHVTTVAPTLRSVKLDAALTDLSNKQGSIVHAGKTYFHGSVGFPVAHVLAALTKKGYVAEAPTMAVSSPSFSNTPQPASQNGYAAYQASFVPSGLRLFIENATGKVHAQKTSSNIRLILIRSLADGEASGVLTFTYRGLKFFLAVPEYAASYQEQRFLRYPKSTNLYQLEYEADFSASGNEETTEMIYRGGLVKPISLFFSQRVLQLPPTLKGSGHQFSISNDEVLDLAADVEILGRETSLTKQTETLTLHLPLTDYLNEDPLSKTEAVELVASYLDFKGYYNLADF